MERKIGFTPISHSGKECVLRVELLPHNNLEAATGFEPVIKVLQTSALPLGDVAIYYNKWCPEAESNHRHGDFQSPALPTELSRLIFGGPSWTRTSDLTLIRRAL